MHEYLFAGLPASLADILYSREARAKMQHALIERFQAPLVCFTCNIPGAVKRCAAAKRVFAAGQEALRGAFDARGYTLIHTRTRDLLTGPEGYYIPALQQGAGSDTAAYALKLLCAGIEQTHPLGRLFDIDVIGMDKKPVSRSAIGLTARSCIVCGGPAIACVSRQKHAPVDLQSAIADILAQI